jgi:FixJ family two-component response regulator
MFGKGVVVVEDDAGLRAALEKVLSAGGHSRMTFESAEALLESGAAAGAGCLVLDIRLPGMSGVELYRELVARGSAPPVIFMTAYDDLAVRAETERLGAAAYLVKPFRGRELVDAVSETLGVNAGR